MLILFLKFVNWRCLKKNNKISVVVVVIEILFSDGFFFVFSSFRLINVLENLIVSKLAFFVFTEFMKQILGSSSYVNNA